MPLLHEPIPDEHKIMAFEVWFLEAGRSPKTTSDILRNEHQIEIRPDTISQWTKVHNWHIEANNRLALIAPGMKVEMLSNLLVAGVKASRLIPQLLQNAADGYRLDGAASKLAVETMHLVGFSPIGTRNPLDSQRSAVVDRSRLMELYHSDEEIRELMESGQRAIEVIHEQEQNSIVAGEMADYFRNGDRSLADSPDPTGDSGD